MRNIALLTLRTTVGGYVATHGAQKLFGFAGGPGLDKAGAGFETMGLRPGRPMATLAGGSEFAGGLLTVAGLASPLGPVMSAATMAVAATAGHRGKGPLAANHGFELPLTYAAAMLALAILGPGRISVDGVLGTHLPKPVGYALLAGGALAAAGMIGLSEVQRRSAADAATDSAPPTGATVSDPVADVAALEAATSRNGHATTPQPSPAES